MSQTLLMSRPQLIVPGVALQSVTAILKWILLLAYTRLGWLISAHYSSKIVLGSILLGLDQACSGLFMIQNRGSLDSS